MKHINSVPHTTLHCAQICLKLANNFRNYWLEIRRQLHSITTVILFPWGKPKQFFTFNDFWKSSVIWLLWFLTWENSGLNCGCTSGVPNIKGWHLFPDIVQMNYEKYRSELKGSLFLCIIKRLIEVHLLRQFPDYLRCLRYLRDALWKPNEAFLPSAPNILSTHLFALFVPWIWRYSAVFLFYHECLGLRLMLHQAHSGFIAQALNPEVWWPPCRQKAIQHCCDSWTSSTFVVSLISVKGHRK